MRKPGSARDPLGTVHPQYGTLEDVRRFLDEAHARGLQVITELVINHYATSVSRRSRATLISSSFTT